MEKADQDLLLRLASNNDRLRSLYEEHLELEEKLREFERFPAYTARDSVRERTLKKRKLRGMDSIMAILNEHRNDGMIEQVMT